MERYSGVFVKRRSCTAEFLAREDFWLLWRPVTAASFCHAVHHSTPPRSGLNFATMLAVEGVPQTSPTVSPSPQTNESPAKQQQTTKKKGFWPWSKREKATPAPSTSPTVVVGKPKRQKKRVLISQRKDQSRFPRRAHRARPLHDRLRT